MPSSPEPAGDAVRRTLVIPMYQEAARIGPTLATLAASGLVGPGTEVVLVDDGSSDGTSDIAERALVTHRLAGRVVRLPRNVGKGGAVGAGIAVARGRAVAFADADLAAPPDAIARCFEVIERGDADVVVATRVHAVRRPLLRRVGSGVFAQLTRRAGLGRHADTQAGLKAFTAEAARTLFRDLSVRRFAFDVEVLLRAELAGLRVVEVPIPWRHAAGGNVRPLRDGARMVVDLVRIRGRLRGWQPEGPSALPTVALLERRHWWYTSTRDLVTDRLRAAGVGTGPALDVGCGTGAMVDRLGELGIEPRIGLDPNPDALPWARGHGVAPAGLAAGPMTALPVRGGSLCAVTALDVLEYLDDDAAALREYARVLRPGGVLVVSVPANEWAWSEYDVAFGHRRRYSAPGLGAALAGAGLVVEHVTAYHAWLTPVALLLRRTPAAKLLTEPERATFVHPRLNRLLVAVARVERLVARRRRLPVGMSLLAVARR
jgi:SAM-dependent methyltransferase